MKDEDLRRKVEKILRKGGFSSVQAYVEGGTVFLRGYLDSWDKIVELGHKVAKIECDEVVNDIAYGKITKVRKEAKIKLPKELYDPCLPNFVDVVIIGGGVIGCFIARELSRYELDVVLLEKECDICGGATKSNSAQIHIGIGESFGTLKRKLCIKAWPKFEQIARELDVPYQKIGLLMVTTEESLPRKIPFSIRIFLCRYVLPLIILVLGRLVGDRPKILWRKELSRREPNLSEKVLAGVLMPGYGVIDPFRLTIALAENAIENGVRIFIDTEVIGIEVEDRKVQAVVTTRGKIRTRFVINAAGVHADEVAEMAGAREFTIHPRKGSTILFDKKLKGYSTFQVSEFKIPREEYTKGGGAFKTVDGNISFGPSAIEVPEKEDTSVTRYEVDAILRKYSRIFSNFPGEFVINYFAGLRACTYKEDFFIRPSRKVKGLIQVAGIQSPGLTAAPAIAEMVLGILRSEGLSLREKAKFNPICRRPVIFREQSLEMKRELIKENPWYGKIVCRCEQVTEVEIVQVIHSPIPALTMDAVKRRTRTGMGRCQGGFCGPLVAKILARELRIPLTEVTKSGGASLLFLGKTKEYVENGG